MIKILAILAILFLSGCASRVPSPDPYQDVPWDQPPQTGVLYRRAF